MFTPRLEPDPVPRAAPEGSAPTAPPGWPAHVRPAGTADWERTAVAWLLDLCPPEFRGYPALTRHPVVLARLAVLQVEARRAAIGEALSAARGALRDHCGPSVIEGALQALLTEQARLLGERRAVGLVEEAVRGRRFVAEMGWRA